MRKLHLVAPLVAFLPLTLSACSDGAFGTGVPPETVLDEASEQDLQDLCVAVSNEILALVTGPIQRAFCTSVGIRVDSASVSCREARDVCISNAEPPMVTSCDNINMAAFDACDTTVGEAEDCMRQLRANVNRISGQITCSLTPEDLDTIDIGVEDLLPADCTAIAEECPALGMLLSFDLDTIE